MKTWFLALTQRERIMVISAGFVILVFMFYLLILEPISRNYTSNKKNIENSLETITWMHTAAKEINQLRGSRLLSGRSQGKQFTLSIIDKSIKKSGLSSVMKRVQPEGETGVRVWFENAAFDELIRWLARIESEQGLRVNEMNIEQTESTGLVDVRVFLD